MSLRTALSAAAGLLLAATTAVGPAHGAAVDDYADYEPQQGCASSAKPGTAYLIRWLMRQYPGTGNASTLRACTSGTSEHKDGRALDWAVNADNAAQRATAYKFLDRVFATDGRGNSHALARRMGIMYLIWDDHIWSAYGSPGFQKRAYNGCGSTPLRKCSKTTRHRDHVHISLSHSGAAAQTTFYRSRNVPSIPVLIPGTAQIDPVDTAIAKISVPVDGSPVRTSFKLTRGQTYRIVGDGLYRFGPGTKISDAACRWGAGAGRWVPHNGGLLVNGTNPWGTSCGDSHTKVAQYKARSTSRLTLQVGDTRPAGNSGEMTFYILRSDIPLRTVATRFAASSGAPRPARSAGPWARQLVKESVTVRAASSRGPRTARSLRTRHRYRVVVTGVASSGGVRFDGQCVRYAGRYRNQHTLDVTRPAADHLSVYIQGVKVNLRAPGGSAGACDSKGHRYVGTFRPVVNGKSRVKVWDPYSYADNTGALTVTLQRKA